MSAASAAPATYRSAHTPTVGSLLRAELLRIRSRRFVRWTVISVFALLVLIAVIAFRQTAKSGAAPPLLSDLPDQLLGVGAAVGVVGFVLGCTLGGAEWSNRTMPALLFWEPRRVRLFLVKVLAVTVAMLLLLTVTLVLWSLVHLGLVVAYGADGDSTAGLANELLGSVVRAVVVAVSAALLGFVLANLTRNTGAALGVAFVYFVIVDNVLSYFVPWLVRWLLAPNLYAVLTDGGEDTSTRTGPVHIDDVTGGVMVVLYVVVLGAVAAWLFRRRDVT